MSFSELITFLPWIIIAITFVFLIPALLHWLWNTTMPDVFALKPITYWQAFRLFVMAFLLFGMWQTGGQ
jgi:hypothetical protein